VNRLASETSPYLRQHADNPVDWYPWGDEAFARARGEDRPVLLSVGYSSCHWCHVMAHESFEDEKTAALVNAGFVAVKVDREERPDIDAVYMEAVQAITGRGGWPMTVFLTPDGRPFYAGTYFPPRDAHGTPGFGRVLDAIEEAWRERRDEVEGQADSLVAAIDRRVTMPGDLVGDGAGPGLDPGARFPGLLAAATAELAGRYDTAGGGFGPAPKFPQPALLELCLEHGHLTGDVGSLAMAEGTLAAMAAGGIYDHLGGGFARYSTDASWTVPHFEKMLYDQAGLVRSYLHAGLITGDERWPQVVEETIGYVLRDLVAPGGGLYCAEDADSEGEEGRFYVWSRAELSAVAGDDLGAVAAEWYAVTEAGNFEGRNILRRPPGAALRRPADVEEARRLLFEARGHRVRPALDDKILTEWNAMFCSALAEAAAASGRTDWATAAVGVAEFLLTHLRRRDGRWLRSWQGGQARHLAYAGDYAWVVDCLTRVGELTGEARFLDEATETAGAMLELFAADDGPLFTTGSDAEKLVVRPTELLDGATPSASAVAAGALLRLGALTGADALSVAGERLLATLVPVAELHPLAVAHAIAACGLAGGGLTEVVVAGDRPDLLATVRRRYEPTVVVAWGERTAAPVWTGRVDGSAYVCRHYACREPATSTEALEAHLDAERAGDRARHGAALARARSGTEEAP
jgi:uncharacterized protein YyaL (SSP411 family)